MKRRKGEEVKKRKETIERWNERTMERKEKMRRRQK